MTLTFKHFDTRLGEWIYTDGNRDNPESLLVETLDNTLLEVYLPNLEFSFGHIDEKSTPADLHRHPSGQVLLLSSKSRMLFGPPEALDTIEALCPDKKDRGAYGSIFLGACHNAIARELNVLVVDDSTGANGGILPDDVAWRQVGDCHGKCSPALARELSDTIEHVIQHRMALPEEMRFAKGTLAPKDLTQLPSRHPDTPIDLIVPTSSFKGGDRKNHPIEPGLHTTTVWLGEKDRSKEGTVAISQVHASFPTGIKDYLRSLEAQAQILHARQKDPRKLAESYCEQHEKRQALGSETSEEQSDPTIYRIIKADLESGHGQLLESPKVQGELNRFVQNRWKEIAIGKTIEFARGLIIPSKDLKHGEICVPSLPEGEEVLNFRSPLLNSNGMCVSLNKYVDDALAPNGKPLTGVIVVNDEDRSRIQARLDALKAQGIETDERVPVETESERQGRDYDGDCIGVARALDFQELSAEAKFRNRPENAYAPVEKAEKVSFPSGMSFEEIAIFMSDGISVGVINNHATAIEALESEIDLLRESGTESDRIEYVQQVGAHYHKLLQSDAENEPIPESYRERASQICDIARGDLNPEAIDRALTLNRSIYHDLVGEAAKENQKAVDIFKSNNPPDLGKIRQNDRLLYRIPNYIRDKKQAGIYSAPDRTIATPGCSPVELMVRQANGYFQGAALEPRPMQQFRDLFPEDYTPAQKQAVVGAKHEFDRRFNLAAAYNTKLKTEKGPVLKVTTARGTQFEVTNLTRFDAIDTLAGGNLDIKLVENRESRKFPHRLLALAKTDAGRYEPLGTVCEIARQREGLHANLETRNAQTQLSAPVTEKQVKLMFVGAREWAVEFCQSLREAERPQYAAAAWHLATTVESQRSGGQPYKTSNFVFAAFGEEILGQLGTLQLRTCVATGIQHHENQLPNEVWQDGRSLKLEIGVNTNEDSQRYGKPVILVEDPLDRQYKEFGLLNQHNAQFPIGTKARATISADPPATATLSLDAPQIPQPIAIGKVREGDFAPTPLVGQRLSVTLERHQPPPKSVLKLEGKIIGELDEDSVAGLSGTNLSKGGQLQVKLETYGRGSGTYTLATTPEGKTLRANKHAHNPYKNRQFHGETFNITYDEVPARPVMRALVGDKVLGTFTANQKTAKQALTQAGMFRDGVVFSATVRGNSTTATVRIDPDSVEYPQTWQRVRDLAPPERPTSPPQKADRLLAQLKQQPTLYFQQVRGGKDTLGFAVGQEATERTANWLRTKQIPFESPSPNHPEVEMETERGYRVFRVEVEDVPPAVRNAIENKFGGALDANFSDLETIGEYYRVLESMPKVLLFEQETEAIESSGVPLKVKALVETVEDANASMAGESCAARWWELADSLDGDDWTWIVGHTPVTAPPRSDAAISMAFGAGLEDLQRAIDMAPPPEVSAVSVLKSSREELAAVGDSQVQLAPEPPPPEVGATVQSDRPCVSETEAISRSRRLESPTEKLETSENSPIQQVSEFPPLEVEAAAPGHDLPSMSAPPPEAMDDRALRDDPLENFGSNSVARFSEVRTARSHNVHCSPPAPPTPPASPTPPAPPAHQTRVDRNLEYSYTTARGGLEGETDGETRSQESASEVKSPPKPEKSQTQPPSVPSFLPEKLPMSDRLSPSIGQQVQQQRTQFVADVVARTLDLVGRHEHSGDEYAAKWNAQTGELTLLAAGEDTPRMVAKLEEGRWKATLGCRLSEEDRQFFEDLSPKLEHLEERQRQQQSSGIEQ